jgi:hypothetical protein
MVAHAILLANALPASNDWESVNGAKEFVQFPPKCGIFRDPSGMIRHHLSARIAAVDAPRTFFLSSR